MADVSSFDGISADPLTTQQIQAIINRIDLNIYNLMGDGKLCAIRNGQNGPTGTQVDRSVGLAELRRTREFYVKMLEDQPFEVRHQYDDPAF